MTEYVYIVIVFNGMGYPDRMMWYSTKMAAQSSVVYYRKQGKNSSLFKIKCDINKEFSDD